MEHAVLIDISDRPRRESLLVKDLAIDLLHQIRLRDPAVESRVTDGRDKRILIRRRRGQRDRPRDRAVDLFHLEEREVKPWTRLDVADPFHLEDLRV
ncbi:MAG: hypothetical protein ABL907_24945, partial [Hyphomicrobium sp.]